MRLFVLNNVLPVLVTAAMLLVSIVTHAAEDPLKDEKREQRAALCPPGFVTPLIKTKNNSDLSTKVDADQAQVDSNQVTTFSGTVKIQQGDTNIEADTIRYDRRTEDFTAKGHVLFTDDIWRFEGHDAQFNLKTNTGIINDGAYTNQETLLRGDAKQVELLGKNKLQLTEATFTSCPKEDVAWKLSASTITLDNTIHQGYAHNVTLEFMSVPFFYLPYMRFPLGEDRLSGFLYPGFGTSKRNGNEFNIPYYWNIAPNYDATINPHLISKRGWMLETEFRYLTEKSRGKLDVNYLANDKLFADDRSRIIWNHEGAPEAGWSTLITYNGVSDTQYLSDFSNSLANSSITHLDRRGELTYNATLYEFAIQAQDYQTITGSEPYKRLPQLNVASRFNNQDNTFNYDVKSELVRYEHLDPGKDVGTRFRLNPFVSYPLRDTPGFFIPKIAVHYIQYNLERGTTTPPADPALPDAPHLAIPVYSIDSGVYLERETRWADVPILHTLEPRLFYLYVPYKDQTTLPNFDTAPSTFNDLAMFSENRFSGGDRIGDANQLTAAVSTRFYRQDNGHELFAATAGELFYFSSRQVTSATGQNIDTTPRSSLFGTVSISPDQYWRLRGDVQWNTEQSHTEIGNTRLQYKPDKDSIINLEYRFSRNTSDTIDNTIRTFGASTAWRFNPRWRVLAGHQFDVQNDHKLENFFGIQYDSCCWGIRLIARERFDKLDINNNLVFDQAIYLTLELKGLSSIGQQSETRSLLETQIYGYTE